MENSQKETRPTPSFPLIIPFFCLPNTLAQEVLQVTRDCKILDMECNLWSTFLSCKGSGLFSILKYPKNNIKNTNKATKKYKL